MTINHEKVPSKTVSFDKKLQNYFFNKNLSTGNNAKRSQVCMPNIINLIKLTAKKIKFYFLNNFNVKNKNNELLWLMIK